MTDEQRVDKVLELNPVKGDNDSMFLPVDLRARILALLREEREACARIADVKVQRPWPETAVEAATEIAARIRARGKNAPLGANP